MPRHNISGSMIPKYNNYPQNPDMFDKSTYVDLPKPKKTDIQKNGKRIHSRKEFLYQFVSYKFFNKNVLKL